MRTSAFLLFEVLVAILIASTVLVIILQGMGSALRAGNVAENYFKARVLAESKMAMLEKEAAWKSDVSSGKFTDEEDPEGVFTWKQEIKPVVTTMWGTTTIPVNEAKVTVRWEERKMELVTYVSKHEESDDER